MTTFPASDHAVVASDDRVLHSAVAAYLGRYRDESRVHTDSDLKVFLTSLKRKRTRRGRRPAVVLDIE